MTMILINLVRHNYISKIPKIALSKWHVCYLSTLHQYNVFVTIKIFFTSSEFIECSPTLKGTNIFCCLNKFSHLHTRITTNCQHFKIWFTSRFLSSKIERDMLIRNIISLSMHIIRTLFGYARVRQSVYLQLWASHLKFRGVHCILNSVDYFSVLASFPGSPFPLQFYTNVHACANYMRIGKGEGEQGMESHPPVTFWPWFGMNMIIHPRLIYYLVLHVTGPVGT